MVEWVQSRGMPRLQAMYQTETSKTETEKLE